MSHDHNEALYKKLVEEEYATLNNMIVGEDSVVTEMTILKMVARAAATMDFVFMYTAKYFDAVQEAKQQDGFQVGEASNGFEASAGGL